MCQKIYTEASCLSGNNIHYSKTSVIQSNAVRKVRGAGKDDTPGVWGKLPSQEPSMEIFQHKNNTYILTYSMEHSPS
jgi:hypothetical protein